MPIYFYSTLTVCEVIALLRIEKNSRISSLNFYELNNMRPCHPTIPFAFADVMGIGAIFWIYISYRESHSAA
jgi:hypothetical protein